MLLDVASWQQQDDLDFWRDLLMSHYIEPALGLDEPIIVYDYPASQAALAQVRAGEPAVAERFELYWQGVELANAYQELGDADEQSARIKNEQKQRLVMGLPDAPADQHLLDAISAGFPRCAGIALGIDRLFMLHMGQTDIRKALSFSFSRA
jgi:lysyl-tRNA synthetase class 2